MKKRKRPRISMSREVVCESGGDFLPSFLSNISSDGVFIETPNPLEVNMRLRISFDIPEIDEPLTITGTVVWVRTMGKSQKPGMGIRFDRMMQEDREKFDRFLVEYRGE